VKLKVADIVFVLDREQGGRFVLERNSLRIHSVIGLGYALDYLVRAGKINETVCAQVKNFVLANQFN